MERWVALAGYMVGVVWLFLNAAVELATGASISAELLKALGQYHTFSGNGFVRNHDFTHSNTNT